MKRYGVEVARLRHAPRTDGLAQVAGIARTLHVPGPGWVLVDWLRDVYRPLREQYECERRLRGQLPKLKPASYEELARLMGR